MPNKAKRDRLPVENYLRYIMAMTVLGELVMHPERYDCLLPHERALLEQQCSETIGAVMVPPKHYST